MATIHLYKNCLNFFWVFIEFLYVLYSEEGLAVLAGVLSMGLELLSS
jgi:hypothetical protein